MLGSKSPSMCSPSPNSFLLMPSDHPSSFQEVFLRFAMVFDGTLLVQQGTGPILVVA